MGAPTYTATVVLQSFPTINPWLLRLLLATPTVSTGRPHSDIRSFYARAVKHSGNHPTNAQRYHSTKMSKT